MREKPNYTPEQYRDILETIAGRMSTLHHLIMQVQGHHEEYIKDICLDAAQVIAVDVGALADSAVGGSIIGGPEYWHYGPNFEHRGKEVSHG